MFLVSSCSCLCAIYWNQVLSRIWRCGWSSADRRCSDYIWEINNFIAYQGAAFIRNLTVYVPCATSVKKPLNNAIRNLFINIDASEPFTCGILLMKHKYACAFHGIHQYCNVAGCGDVHSRKKTFVLFIVDTMATADLTNQGTSSYDDNPSGLMGVIYKLYLFFTNILVIHSSFFICI